MDGGRIRDDDRAARRDLAGVLVGGLTGLPVGLLLGLRFPGPAQPVALIVAGMLGAALAAVLGRWLARRISADEIEPHASNRPFVGGHSPDGDS
jgi:hypothetical protein